jgi:hypothetical protein
MLPCQADEPLEAAIPLLADSGPLSLPFKALVRQALPSIDPCPVVSLDGRAGGVMLGASGHTTVTISNAGVLSMLYSVKVRSVTQSLICAHVHGSERLPS